MINYLIVTWIVICALFLIKFLWELINKYRKPMSARDQLQADPKFRDAKILFDIMREMNKEGTYNDIIPEGVGEFGYDVTNPIPVNTLFGNEAYLGRLRTPEGVKVRYVRKGSTGVKNIKNPIDIYDIFNGEEFIATLYISPYQKKNSEIAPKGFKLEGSA